MEEALRIIVAKSPNAASFALQCLKAIRAKSPVVQVRYNQTVEIALNDPQAAFSSEERILLAQGLASGEPEGRDYMLRIRLTEAERASLATLSEEAGVTMSEYVRQRLFE